MNIELTDADLGMIVAHARERMAFALNEYGILRGVLCLKMPALTDEVIAAMQAAVRDGSHTFDGEPQTNAAHACACFQFATSRCAEAVKLIEADGACSEVVRNLFVCTSEAFAALGSLALVLAGGPELAQAYMTRGVRDMRAKSATHAANARHGQPGGNRERHDRLRALWASGKYKSRDECADRERGALGLSFSAARKALRGTPEPGRA